MPTTKPSLGTKAMGDGFNSSSLQDEPLQGVSNSAMDPTVDPFDERPVLQSWNRPKINTFRFLSAVYSFIILGMNDAAYGALLPYLGIYYQVDYTTISMVFLAQFVGYIVAAFLNNAIHNQYGQLGVAAIAPLSKLVAYLVACTHPPYLVLPIVFTFVGFGNGLEDGGWNAWIGNMEHANELLGFLHAGYGLGATISPFVATAMITKGNLPWYYFYYLMILMVALEWGFCIFAFRDATGANYRAANEEANGKTDSSSGTESSTGEALRNSVTWIIAIFLFLYTGVEVGLGGWLVTFMLEVRHGQRFASGLVETGFWLGLTVGRLSLGFITGRMGEKLATVVYLVLSMISELCFWLIPSFVSSAIFAALVGILLGPMFPAAIVVGTKLLPQRLHVSAIGFAAAAGSGGGAIWPFAVGAIAQAKGVQVLQPIILALIAAGLVLWCLLPGGFKLAPSQDPPEESMDMSEQRYSLLKQ